MRSRAFGALLVLAAALACSACSIAYVPGDEVQQKANASDPAQLRSLVLVLANRCTARVVGGTVANRSTSRLRIVVEGQMFTPAGTQKNVDVTVAVPAAKTLPWQAPAPRGTTPAGGCQGYAKKISVTG